LSLVKKFLGHCAFSKILIKTITATKVEEWRKRRNMKRNKKTMNGG
jgi:hypothetical protein